MRAELIIEQGQARLLDPVYLRATAPIHINIDIPEELIEPSKDWFYQREAKSIEPRVPNAKPGSLQEELNKILGSLAKVRPSSSIGDDHQMLLDAMEEKYLGR